jgi:gluconate:H+ symporter, GntP family
MLTGTTLLLVIFSAIVFIILAAAVWKIHPFINLLLACIGVGIAVRMPLPALVKAINDGFGSLLGYIGMIVVLGSILGVFLEKSGAALRLAELILRLTGRRRPALAMSMIGGAVGVPVFCDSGFILLSGLNKALADRSGQSRATLSLALASGLYTTHTLVPPTPGPIAAAGNIGAGDYLGLVMLFGLIVAVPVVIVANVWATRIGKNIITNDEDSIAEEPGRLPPAIPSVLPIAVPVLLIALASFSSFRQWKGDWAEALQFIGHPLPALMIGLLFAVRLLPKWDGGIFSEWTGEGVKLAGPILVITGAGGAFGSVLKATPLAADVERWIGDGGFSGGLFLLVAFGIAALFKTAQGSSTSALVITSSMLAPLMPALGFTSPAEMALVVTTIGGGAMLFSHANDSYFWVVSRFSGISLPDAYRSFTVMTGIQGLTVLLMTQLLWWMVGSFQ